MDLVTPPIASVPGRVIGSKNYEPEARGYRRMEGYERFDGQPKPSEASYWIVDFDGGDTAVVTDDVVTAPGGSGTALFNGVLESGTYGGADAAGYLVLTDLTGVFVNNDQLQVSAGNVALAASAHLELGADTVTLDDTYLQAAIEARRTDILEIPGSGPVRGVAALLGTVYAWRDNTGATAVDMFKATTSGWSIQSFGSVIYFTAGTAEFLVGETLTGGTSSATAQIDRVIKMSGSWGSDAAGYLVIGTVTGGPFQAETITSASGSATATAAEVAITLPAGGTYRSIEHNFFGIKAFTRLYVVNGVGRAFEWDGTILAPIDTGALAADDKPTHVAEFADHLVLG